MDKKQQLLRDPDTYPSGEVLAKVLGPANTAYVTFVGALASHDITLVWHYYNDGKAWLAKGLFKWTGPRGGLKETTVFWLSIWDGFFKVTIYAPEKLRKELLQLPLGNAVLQRIADTPQMGKMNHFPIVFDLCAEDMFADILLLCDFRKSNK